MYPDQPYLTVPEINSCLVNKYEGSESYLPKHSDCEVSIHPESSIFTISLGQSCDIKFTERESGSVSSQSCPDRSLYVMSRRSQEVFDHEIEQGSMSDGTRYSLTFRCVSWTHKNSTCMIGDSNTRFLRFGSHRRGTFGEQMPGQKFWAPKIRDIDPVSCMGYSNVVLLCGINDIKESHVQCEKDVADCYAELKLKIKQIKLLSPSTKAVFVCQLLPTKDLTLNRKVNDFNRLLHFDLFPTCKDVEFVEGFNQFVCNRVLAAELSMHLDRHGRFDMLHLNRAGGRVLAGMTDDKMKKIDDQLKKTKADTKRLAGRPRNKVLRSPQKSLTGSSSDDYCPCKKYMEGELSVECQSCLKFWHLYCVGLKGLSEEMVESLENWQCSDCYLCPHSYKEKITSTSSSGTMKVMIRDELNAIQPVIKVTVENAVRNILSKSVCSKEDVEGVVKSYAAVARESQKEVIQQAALAQSSKKVVESVVRQMDADKVEREKRRSNVVVLSAPEPEKEASAEQKKKEDKNFCSNVLGIPLKDVETCWRAGKIDVSKPDYLRPLVIKLKSEGLVEEWTKDGKGYKTESGFWINKDLCAADRKANFLAREQRRTRLQKT
ncbi:hypothetical protein ACHWQZ_G015695 [Mnemiopsis leidyi]